MPTALRIKPRLRHVSILAGLSVACLLSTSQATAKETLTLAIGGEPEQGFDPLLGWGQYGHPLFQSTLLTEGEDFSPARRSPPIGRSPMTGAPGS